MTTYKILPNFFAFFWSQNWRTFYPLLHMKSCPIFLPFLKPKVEDLKLMTTPYFSQILCLFWSQKWRTFYHLLDMKCCPNVLPFWSQNWRTFYSLLNMKSCPFFLPFLEPKLEDFLSLTTYEACILYVHSLSFDDFFSLTRQKRSKWTGNFDFASVTVNTFTIISFFDKSTNIDKLYLLRTTWHSIFANTNSF